jgi:hypothetical protein
MRASVGDRIVVRGHRTGEANRDAEVLEVHGADGAPPFVVRWGDDGHVGTYYPGPDAQVVHPDDGVADEPAVEDPLRRDLLDGLVALRADMLRLRSALSRVTGAGTGLRTAATDSLSRRVAQVECEIAALVGEVKAGQADTVTAVRSAVDDAVRSVRTVVDELRVQASLGSAEVEDTWQQAVKAFEQLREDPAAGIDAAKSLANDVLARLRAVVA